ncbi:unnamed protein product [Parnassius apollo]|uniref:(apollo) hypothetical protein n=1 Tax=Parnassius apollo TaxID=110799 RepID=A0A8S3XZG3_PARAO|nr:unnamed protein product [Parnassius apollo]
MKLQGGDSNIIHHRDAITAYTEKLQLWKRQILASNYSFFPKLLAITEEACFKEILDVIDTKNQISNHLQHLTDEFKRYFTDSCNNIMYRLVTDPFHVDIDMLPDTLQEQVLEIKNDSAAQYDFEKMDKALFWIKYLKVYPEHSRAGTKIISTFFKHLFVQKSIFSSCSNKNKV